MLSTNEEAFPQCWVPGRVEQGESHLTDGAMEGHDPGHGPSFTLSSIKHLALFSRNEDTDTHWRSQNGNVSIQTVSL